MEVVRSALHACTRLTELDASGETRCTGDESGEGWTEHERNGEGVRSGTRREGLTQ